MQPLVALVALFAAVAVVAGKNECYHGNTREESAHTDIDGYDPFRQRCKGQRCYKVFATTYKKEGKKGYIISTGIEKGCADKKACKAFKAKDGCDTMDKDEYVERAGEAGIALRGEPRSRRSVTDKPEGGAQFKDDDDDDDMPDSEFVVCCCDDDMCNAATAKTLPALAVLLGLAAAAAFAALG